MEKLRILCLHGYHGSARVLQDQMRPLAQALEHLAEFVYVEAPSIAQGDFGWWHATRSEAAPRLGHPGIAPAAARYDGWPRTREAIASISDSEGPFDGVFGFSQGAALAALLVCLRSALPAPHRPLAFDFVMMAGAFLAIDPALAKFYSARASYDLPSVHIFGQADSVVPAAYSQKVAAQFKDPLVLQHDGGHVIASTQSIREQIVAFLQQRAELRWTSTVSRAAVPPFRTIEVPLWRGRAHPSMRFVFPRVGTSGPRPAMLIFRGGAYAYSSGSGEGSARWCAEHGMVGIEWSMRLGERRAFSQRTMRTRPDRCA